MKTKTSIEIRIGAHWIPQRRLKQIDARRISEGKAFMIESASEFIKLLESEDRCENHRATHDEASVEVCEEVIRIRADLRSWVAYNKKVPIAILWRLADDPDSDVRYRVAMKRKLTEPLQLKLLGDSDPCVRQRLAYNAKATTGVLQELARDPDPFVSEVALKRLSP